MKPSANPFLILSAACIVIGTASAATWTGATNASWATAGNWTGTAPDNTTPQAIVFDSTSTANLNPQTLNASYTVTGITLGSPTGAVVVNNGTGTNTLTLGSGGIGLSTATQNLTLNVNTTVGATQSWNIASGRTLLRSGGTTTFDTSTITTLSGAGTVELGGTQVLAGSGALIVDGPTLFNNLQGGTQTRSGTTTLTSGTIKIQTSVSMFGSGALNINGGAIGSGNGSRRIISNAVNIGGNFSVGGTGLSTGAIQLSGAVDFGSVSRQITTASIFELTGTVANAPALDKLGTGSLVLGVVNLSGTDLALSAGKLLLGGNGGSAEIGSLSGVAGTSIDSNYNLVSDGLRSLTVNQTTAGEYAGVISNAGGTARAISLVKSGSATLTLSGANTYTGTTTINTGTLKLGGAGTLGNGTYAATITNAGTLHFDSSAAQTLTGTLTGSGALLKSSSGTLTIDATATATGFNGPITVSGGILTINSVVGGNLSVSGGRLVLNSAITGNVSASSTGTFGGTGSSTGDLDMTDGTTLLLAGGGTTTGMAFDGVTFGGTVYLEFASSPVDATVYDVVTYGAGGRTGFASLSPLARGTLTDDTVNNKITFTSGTPGTRTWNTGDGTWNRFGTLTNWAEGDQVYYQGDDVVFGDIGSDTTITLVGLLAPFSVTVENTANTYTFAGTGGLSGGGFFDKLEAGTLEIANPNPNFTGSTAILGGTFRIVDGGSWGTGPIGNDATLEINQTTNLTLASAISGTGTLVKNNTGTLRLTGANSYTGATTVNAGILQAGANNAFGTGTLAINGGIVSSDSGSTWTLANNLVLATNPTFGDGINGGLLDFTGTVDLQGASRSIVSNLTGGQGVRFSGAIGNGSLELNGVANGILTLASDSNSYTGATTVTSGYLAISNNALGTSTSVSLAADTRLYVGVNGTTGINNLSGAATASIRSDFTITGGSGDRILSINQSTDGTFDGSFAQGSSRPISLVKEGAATLTLTGTGSFGGTTTVNSGTLKIGGAGLLGGATYGGAITNNATLHFDSTANQTLSGEISGSGTLLKSNTGTLILTNNNDGNTGLVTITGGTLQIGNNTGGGFIGNSATVTNNAALVWYRSNETNVGNDIAGTGTLTKLGTAALNLNGDSSYTGDTTVTAGTLRVNGSLGNTAVTVADGATLAGNGNIGGSVTLESGGTHVLAVAATSGAQVTRTIGGSLTLDSGNILSLTAATAPAAGTYILATATGGITGSLDTINLAPEITGSVSISGNSLVLTVSAASPFDDWASANGLDGSAGKEAGFDDDPDGDSVANGLEWILGGNPLDGQSGTLVTTTATASGGLTLGFTRNEDSIGEATLTVEYNTDLGAVWNSATIGATSSGPDANGVTVTIDTGATPDAVSVNIPASNAPAGKLFGRLKATQP